jgi:hypothetical protein
LLMYSFFRYFEVRLNADLTSLLGSLVGLS